MTLNTISITVDDENSALTVVQDGEWIVEIKYSKLSIHLPSQSKGAYHTIVFEAKEEE